MRVKATCKRAGIERLDTGPKGATVVFRDNRFADPAGLVGYLHDAERPGEGASDNRLVIRRDWNDDKDRVRGAYAIARDLARIAEKGRLIRFRTKQIERGSAPGVCAINTFSLKDQSFATCPHVDAWNVARVLFSRTSYEPALQPRRGQVSDSR